MFFRKDETVTELSAKFSDPKTSPEESHWYLLLESTMEYVFRWKICCNTRTYSFVFKWNNFQEHSLRWEGCRRWDIIPGTTSDVTESTPSIQFRFSQFQKELYWRSCRHFRTLQPNCVFPTFFCPAINKMCSFWGARLRICQHWWLLGDIRFVSS